MKLLLQPFKQAAGIFRLPLSPGFVLLHLFHVPARLFSPVDSYYFTFSIHVFLLFLGFASIFLSVVFTLFPSLVFFLPPLH